MRPDDALCKQLMALFGRLDPHMDPITRATLQLVVDAVAQGHVCVDLQRQAMDAGAQEWPPFTHWLTILQRSPLIGCPGEYTPFILDAPRLYLARHWQDETATAKSLRMRYQRGVPLPDTHQLRLALDTAFPTTVSSIEGRRAAAAAAFLPFTWITGGPGTGKTSTVVNLLYVLQRVFPGLRVRLAAPTGKAAARLQHSLHHATLRFSHGDAMPLPDTASTLHRLLGIGRYSEIPRHHPQNPLPIDLLVIDEASMVDLSMMRRVLDALPVACRLILLGDKAQLASVDAGHVFADLCSDATIDAALATQLAEVGCGPTEIGNGTNALGSCVHTLTHSYRFSQDAPLGQLAAAIQQGDADTACTLFLKHPTTLHQINTDPIEELAHGFDAYWRAIDAGKSVDAIFAAFAQFRVLTPFRTGTRGAIGINQQLQRHWAKQRGWRMEAFEIGQAVIITQNNQTEQLFNGDVGLVLPDAQHRLRVWFEDAAGQYQPKTPARLPAWEAAFAMTVHKSQGSEFEHIALLCPEAHSASLSRPLLYTAITRARQRITLVGTWMQLKAAIAYVPHRDSGLAARLQNHTIKYEIAQMTII